MIFFRSFFLFDIPDKNLIFAYLLLNIFAYFNFYIGNVETIYST